MPISFTPSENPQMFTTKWSGTIDPQEMIHAYSDFFESPFARGRHLEFADFSEADLSEVSVHALRELCETVAEHYRQSGISCARCSSWIPKEINQAFFEIYTFLSKQSPEVTRVFPGRSAAINWLLEGEEGEVNLSV